MISQNSVHCSNSLERIISEGFKEIVGGESLILFNSGLVGGSRKPEENVEHFFGDDQFKAVYREFLKKFGGRGSRGIAYRIGGASFGHFMRLKGENYNLTTTEYHLKNYSKRCLFGLNQLAEFIKQDCGMIIDIVDLQDRWLVEVARSEEQKNWNQLWGDFLTGLIREYLSWTSGGRFFVMNTLPDDQIGDLFYCLSINKQPLGN